MSALVNYAQALYHDKGIAQDFSEAAKLTKIEMEWGHSIGRINHASNLIIGLVADPKTGLALLPADNAALYRLDLAKLSADIPLGSIISCLERAHERGDLPA